MSRHDTFSACVEGVALWAPRLPDWDIARRVLTGAAAAPDTPAPRPTPSLLPPNERRRAPDTVAVALEVAGRACVDAGRDPSTLPSVFASTYGDLAITDYMCETLATAPLQVSPTRFHNSVLNAAAGYWTIATGSMAPYTTVSAFQHTFAQGLLEALTQLRCENTPVLYVAYDIAAKGPLAQVAPSEGMLGVALVLAPQATPRTQAVLRWRLDERADPVAPTPRSTQAALVAGNAMAQCVPLFEALAGIDGAVSYALGPALAIEFTATFPVAAGPREYAHSG